MNRVGVLGGTFDPVHDGHIAIALAAADALALQRVELVPSSRPPHRDPSSLAPVWHRWAMVVLAVAGHDRLFASDRELRRGGISYTIDTLRGYRATAPPSEPVLILGLDAFLELPSWREPEALVAEFALVVACRPGLDPGETFSRLPAWLASRLLPGDAATGAAPGAALPEEACLPGRVALIHPAPCPVSATDVRDRIALGRAISGLVPGPVEEYIQRYNMYGTDDPIHEGRL